MGQRRTGSTAAGAKTIRVKSVNPPPKSDTVWSDLAIFGTVLLSMALFLQTPWAASAWSAFLALPGIDGDARWGSLVMLWLPNLLVYYPYSAMYAVIDLCFHDAFKHKKVQPVRVQFPLDPAGSLRRLSHLTGPTPRVQTSPRPTVAQYVDAALVTGMNTFIVEPVLMCVTAACAGQHKVPHASRSHSHRFLLFKYGWPAWGHCAWTEDACRTMPSLPWALLSVVVFVLCFEVGFYSTHRLGHQRPLYAWIHKLHHTFKSPAALTAKYAHPVEHTFSNLMPLLAGPLLMGAHPLLTLAWVSAGLFQTCTGHSGYWLSPILPTSHMHDWHHEVTHECYGTIGLLDGILGTAARFTARRQGKLPVHIVGVDDGVKEDETWEDSDGEGHSKTA